MGAASNKIYQISDRANPSIVLELRGLAVKEKEFVISNVIMSPDWQAEDFGETDPRTQIPFHPEAQIKEQEILDHFSSLLLNDLNVYDASEGVMLNTAIPRVDSVDISPATVSKAPSTTQQFTKTVLPAGANQSVTWSITSAANLSINQNGLVTIGAVAPGNYTITATSVADGTKTDTAVLTVTS